MCDRCNDGLEDIVGKTVADVALRTVDGDTSDELSLTFSDGSHFTVTSKSHDDSWMKITTGEVRASSQPKLT